jgi:hypothetical protein
LSKVTIYRWHRYRVITDEEVVTGRWATREAIKAARGEILEDTAREVDASDLDGNGFLRAPSAAC